MMLKYVEKLNFYMKKLCNNLKPYGIMKKNFTKYVH